MEKDAIFDMDSEEWELLPREDLCKSVSSKEMPFYPKGIVDVDYYNPSQITLCKTKDQDEKIIEEVKEIKANLPPPASTPKDGDTVDSPFFLNKIKDGGFDDEKTELWWTGRDDREEEEEAADKKAKTTGVEEEKYLCSDFKGKGCRDGIGFNVWGWRFTGIRALCTIGVSAATICIFILGGRYRQKQQHQKIQFQIYTDDKNLKQMVQHATRLNHAISATRGAPMTRANISFGGHHAGL